MVSQEVIEHIGLDYEGSGASDRALYATELQRVLRPCGVVLVATPNRFFLFDAHGGGWTQICFHSFFHDSTLTFGELQQPIAVCETSTLDYHGYLSFEKLSRLRIRVKRVRLL